jgi:membrane protein required for colicin V production
VAAVAAPDFFYKPLVPLVKPYVESGTVSTIIAAAVVFFIALIIASYITTRISDFVIDSRVGAFDRALGFVFGAARGLLLLVIALLFFSWLVQTPPSWVASARTKPMLDNLGERLMAALPEDVESSLLKRFKSTDTDVAPSGDIVPPSEDSSAAPADPAYGSGSRQNLDQLIQNSDN